MHFYISTFLMLQAEYISLQEMKQGQCICPLSWSVHCNFTGDGKCVNVIKGVGVHPPPSPVPANFTLMTELRKKADVTTLCTLWLQACCKNVPFTFSVGTYIVYKTYKKAVNKQFSFCSL
jgi:hypothetical protein